MARAMAVAQLLAERDAFIVSWVSTVKATMPPGLQHIGDRLHDRREIVKIGEDVGGDDEIIALLRGSLGLEERRKLAGLEPVVDALARARARSSPATGRRR